MLENRWTFHLRENIVNTDSVQVTRVKVEKELQKSIVKQNLNSDIYEQSKPFSGYGVPFV